MSSKRCGSPNVRNSESNSSIRRSFSGNPFGRPSVLTNPRSFVVPNTPANSPAEFGRREIGGKEGLSRSFEEKENEKDNNLKGVKFKSPSKGSKNFMAPTISASSKFTPSPRKKILGEVNELVRTSISFDGKEAEDFHSKSEEMGVEENKLADFDKKEVFLEVPKASKRVTSCEVPLNTNVGSEFLSEISSRSDCVVLGDIFPPAPLDIHDGCVNAELISNNSIYSTPVSPILASNGDTLMQTPLTFHDESETVSGIPMESDSVNAGSGFINKNYSSSSEIAPLDADPSLPPYDPKTNYLSPRPKFLRYKPNPRIEVFLSKGKGRKESFGISDTSSDTDVTEGTLSGDSQKESEDGYSPDMPTSEEEQEEKPVISESIPMSSPISSHSPEQTSDVKKASKPMFFTGLKSIFLVLMLLIACASISVTDVPVLNSPAFKDSSFYKLYESSEVAMFAKEKLDGYSRTLLIWSSQAISYLSKSVPRFSEADRLGTLQFSNLTFLEESPLVDGFLGVNHLNSYKIEEIIEDEIIESLEEDDDEFESVEEGNVEITESLEERTESGLFDEHNEVESGHDGGSEVEEVLLPVEQVGVRVSEGSEDVVDHEPSGATAHIAAEPEKSNTGLLEDHLVFSSQAAQIRPAIEPVELNQVVAMETQVDNVFSSSKAEVDFADENLVHSSKLAAVTLTDGSPIYATEYNLSAIFQIYAIVLAIVSTVITIPFLYMKKPLNNSTAPNNVTHVDPLKKTVCSPLPAELMYMNRPFSQNSPPEFDMSGESSYPSEMSSFQKSSSNVASKGTNKSQSQERKPRNSSAKRESLASSEYSSGSPSYGSFTTYERIPVKHVYGEDEIVTPVRRSSRIRSQAVSP